MGAKRCRGCGAQLRLRSTLCPLCGTSEEDAANKFEEADWPDAMVVKTEDYQADMRRLRDELRRLRQAEAS